MEVEDWQARFVSDLALLPNTAPLPWAENTVVPSSESAMKLLGPNRLELSSIRRWVSASARCSNLIAIGWGAGVSSASSSVLPGFEELWLSWSLVVFMFVT